MASGIARFLVSARHLIFAVMVVATVLAGLLAPRVGVITDMAEFLPNDSQMREGLALMDGEFPPSEQLSTTRVMFEGLSSGEEQRIASEMEDIPGVEEVSFDPESDAFRKGERSLFILHSTAPYGSETDRAIQRTVEERFRAERPVIRSDNPSQAAELPLWIVGVAVGLLALILLIMSASWIEPLLFLLTIGMAVVLNLGTNLIRGSVADITFTIGAILQLVLSMDYSIILMNRYRHERALEESKTEAMVKALRGAFSSIVSSSMTTVVGLLMLCFMSLGIGLDLGIALAKGVFLSMLSVFTVLPTLILLTDKALAATRKPHLKPGMSSLARFEYRFRRPIAALFVLIFAGSWVSAAGTPIAYTLSKDDPIAEVFPTENPIVLVYANTDEDDIVRLAKRIEDEPFVRSVSAHSTTIGAQRTLPDMAAALEELDGGGMALDEEALRLVYFLAHGGEATERMTLREFISFLHSDRQASARMAPGLSERLNEIMPYLDRTAMTTPMGAAELAPVLRMSEEDARGVLLQHAVSDPTIHADSMTLAQFVDFLLGDLANDPHYASLLAPSAMIQAHSLAPFTDAGAMTTPIGSEQMAALLGSDPAQMALLYARLAAESGAYSGISALPAAHLAALRALASAIPADQGGMTAEQATALAALAPFTEQKTLTTPMDAQGLAALFSMPVEHVEAVLALLRPMSGSSPPSPPVAEAIVFLDALVQHVLTDPAASAAAGIDSATAAKLRALHTIASSTVKASPMPLADFARAAGIDPQILALAHAVGATQDAAQRTRSPREIVGILVNDPMSASRRGELERLHRIVNDTVAGRAYTPAALASLMGISDLRARQLALLRTAKYSDSSSWRMSPQAAIAFLVDAVLTSPESAGRFTPEQATDLRRLRAIVDAGAEQTAFTPAQLASFFHRIGSEADSASIGLAYLAHAAKTRDGAEKTLSIAELVDVLASRILPDQRFAPFIDADSRAAVEDARERISTALIQLVGTKHSRLIITTTLPVESERTEQFVSGLFSNCEDLEGGCRLVGDSVLIHEMRQSFDTEMTLISLLTAASIFLVVALTFFSLSVPALLVLLVQCGVFLTITAIGLQGYANYYLAQLMVQCILMGATIDYGILLTTQYREARRSLEPAEAIGRALKRSIHTIATSGSIMILVTGILGFLFENPTVGQICRTIAIGALAATALILLVLPGLLVALDRFIAGRSRLGAAAHAKTGEEAPA